MKRIRGLLACAVFALAPCATALAEEMKADVHGLVVPETLDAADAGARLYGERCAS